MSAGMANAARVVHRGGGTARVVHRLSGGSPVEARSPQAGEMRGREPGADEMMIVCPMACEICQQPGDCEDCLDCLCWPRPYDDTPPHPPPARGPSQPAKAAEIARARRDLVAALRVGLVSRRYRRSHGLTQRDLAAELGWSRSVVGRIEADAAHTPFDRVDALLHHVGYRVALIPITEEPVEDPDATWGASDLLARDGQGRRPPPGSQVTWNDESDRRLYTSLCDREWTWSRSAPLTPPS